MGGLRCCTVAVAIVGGTSTFICSSVGLGGSTGRVCGESVGSPHLTREASAGVRSASGLPRLTPVAGSSCLNQHAGSQLAQILLTRAGWNRTAFRDSLFVRFLLYSSGLRPCSRLETFGSILIAYSRLGSWSALACFRRRQSGLDGSWTIFGWLLGRPEEIERRLRRNGGGHSEAE